MRLKKWFCVIIMLAATACIKAQNRCYIFKHSQFVIGTNYNCGAATIMKDDPRSRQNVDVLAAGG